MSDTMTVKELAEVAGVHPQTVRNQVKQLFPDVSQNGRKTFLTAEQSINIMRELRVQVKREIRPSNNLKVLKGGQDLSVFVSLESRVVSLEKNLDQLVTIAANLSQVGAAATACVENLTRAIQQSGQVARTEPEFVTVLAYCLTRGIHPSREQAATYGRNATSICQGIGVTPKQVPDDRWGFVNAYPQFVLAEVIGQ